MGWKSGGVQQVMQVFACVVFKNGPWFTGDCMSCGGDVLFCVSLTTTGCINTTLNTFVDHLGDRL
jgi:hypothetical protein